MFTGIVERVEQGEFLGDVIRLRKCWDDVILGESISVNGVCLTVSKIDSQYLYFDVGKETQILTNLRKSRYYNLERAIRVGDRLSGHYVTGHVDGMVRFVLKNRVSNTIYMYFSLPKEYWGIVNKGAITLNGISLTIASVSIDTFSIQVIPHTYENTNLKYLKSGEEVNYEIDILAKYTWRCLEWKKELYKDNLEL
ncbi:riboflavin synthase [Fervidobacterium riparium]|uniref:Riboflavin synthase n=1 Tax=Fervidobacterium gondwanense DSM 13020 TaxID=1121883 RepID=A0A1M7TAZ1_FERGO|nr:riboflavin synthase [Fervidobacterium gondwanense]UXF00981.1 riboflavin synthase subunit alpha [Fervidobacterium riparium]SHN67891.1 riboflavin synthase alpha chain [Fervidobacterium gondwanense DSM 13020]